MLELRGGLPELAIPDNEKAAVREASRSEPDLDPTYQGLATHYGTTVLPARPRSPRDKAQLEVIGGESSLDSADHQLTEPVPRRQIAYRPVMFPIKLLKSLEQPALFGTVTVSDPPRS